VRATGEPRLLHDAGAIRERVAELARTISRDYATLGELRLVGVLKGAFIFLADLARQLDVPHRVDFIALSSYGDGGEDQGALRLRLDLQTRVSGAHVLVIDDILDTGATLSFVTQLLAAHRPASIRTCVLTRKHKARGATPYADYVGFEIPDVWVVGYGLDHADRFRTLPYIAELPLGEPVRSE
jgi:hypoxanthine phosphoribosyltransferase